MYIIISTFFIGCGIFFCVCIDCDRDIIFCHSCIVFYICEINDLFGFLFYLSRSSGCVEFDSEGDDTSVTHCIVSNIRHYYLRHNWPRAFLWNNAQSMRKETN